MEAEYPVEVSMTINELFILASVMEDLMKEVPQLKMKHEIKFRFNRIFSEVKKLNGLVNITLGEEEIDGFDLITHEVKKLFEGLKAAE
jgi:hypothetical protein